MLRLLIVGMALELAACGNTAAPRVEPASQLEARDVGGPPLDREQIDRVIKSYKGALLACYQRELKRDDALGGKVLIRFVVDHTGVVTEATVVRDRSTLADEAVEGCLLAEFLAMRFPAGGGAVVNYPLIFSNPV